MKRVLIVAAIVAVAALTVVLLRQDDEQPSRDEPVTLATVGYKKPPVPDGFEAAFERATLWRVDGIDVDDRTVAVTIAGDGCTHFGYATATSSDRRVVLEVWAEQWRGIDDRHGCSTPFRTETVRVQLPTNLEGRDIGGACDPDAQTADLFAEFCRGD